MSTRVTSQDVREFKRRGERFAVLTAYDYPTAKLLDDSGIPVLLVGDSLGTVVLGFANTLNVTLDDMVRHAQAVVRGAKRAMVVVDMPFMSFQVSAEDALRNAGRLIQESGAQAVKLEGGLRTADTIRRIVEAGIPVMGHVGLTPQSFNVFGGHKVQGRDLAAAANIIRDAEAVQEAGAFSVVLEGVPAPLAQRITKRLDIPTIGIGAGPECDAQVQVLYDMLGLFDDFVPKHVKHYAQIGQAIKQAVQQYQAEVLAGAFPTAKESFNLSEDVLRELDEALGQP